MTKMREDLRKAKAEIKSAMTGGASGSSSPSSDPVVKVQEERDRKVRSTNASLKEQARLIREGKNLGPNANINKSGKADYSQYGPSMNPSGYGPSWGMPGGTGRAQLSEGRKGGVPPIIPTPPKLPGGGAASNTLSGMLGNLMNFQMSPLGATATKVAGGLAALRVGVGLIGYAAHLALDPIVKLATAMRDHFYRAAEAGRSMYAKQLQSGGLPGGYVAKRSLLGEMLGVGENEVMQYGKAVAYLNEKVRFAQGVYTQTTPQLASASYELRALNNDFKALAMLIAAEFAPAVRQMVYVLRQVVEFVGTTFAKGIAGAFKRVLEAVIQQFGGVTALWAYKTLQKHALGKLDPGKAPGIGVSTNRMPASAWEKMGLVIGHGAGTNWAQQTAKNTARLVEIISNAANPREAGRKDLQPIFAIPG